MTIPESPAARAMYWRRREQIEYRSMVQQQERITRIGDTLALATALLAAAEDRHQDAKAHIASGNDGHHG